MSTLIGATTGVSFGASVESGILIKSFSANAQADKVEVKNAAGDVALIAYHNQRVSGSVAGTIAGTTGVAAASIGAALTLANIQAVGGVTTGTVVVDSVALSKGPDAFQELTVNFTRYPNI
jgi:hypothetical protein